jgi:hypothetical protein
VHLSNKDKHKNSHDSSFIIALKGRGTTQLYSSDIKDKLWLIHKIEYCIAMKKNEDLPNTE